MIVRDNRKPQHRRAIIGTTGYLHEFDLILIAAAKRHAELIILLIHLSVLLKGHIYEEQTKTMETNLFRSALT